MLPLMDLQVGIVSGEICKADFQDKLRNQSFSELTELYYLYMIYLSTKTGNCHSSGFPTWTRLSCIKNIVRWRFTWDNLTYAKHFFAGLFVLAENCKKSV